MPDAVDSDELHSLGFPSRLEYAMAELLVELTALKEERAHHYKQWVGIRYTAEEKVMVAGFRVMRMRRPFGRRCEVIEQAGFFFPRFICFRFGTVCWVC
jgi:hypothetical protein